MPVAYDKQSYWHERFAAETEFEWLLPSRDFVAILQPHLERLDPSSARILNLGSGTSDLQNHLRRQGFLDVTNHDYEPLAAERGRRLEARAFGDVKMRYVVADVTQLSHSGGGSLRGARDDGKFDLIVDKSTVDAVSCGGEAPFLRMARGVRDRLADGAVWISLSYSSQRFDVYGLPFDVEVIAKVSTPKLRATDPDVYHWCYLMRPR
ncbi:Endothelin-converting enzyme 2 [Tolypocladium ophioglossoides CBS 100239]|uniref:Endothelin-converting enzyme 2 n=1 Tax=Tolypocladium ophioglossoides (strain CBS 100239) TaxID=1163406 RepID=A0A0L0NBN4_TOLOC|nr:Endothelin-converting enzyme 2 [Tolypocladium ophioglossoides CBS 100239]